MISINIPPQAVFFAAGATGLVAASNVAGHLIDGSGVADNPTNPDAQGRLVEALGLTGLLAGVATGTVVAASIAPVTAGSTLLRAAAAGIGAGVLLGAGATAIQSLKYTHLTEKHGIDVPDVVGGVSSGIGAAGRRAGEIAADAAERTVNTGAHEWEFITEDAPAVLFGHEQDEFGFGGGSSGPKGKTWFSDSEQGGGAGGGF